MNYKVDYAFQIVGMHLVSALITLVSLTVNGCCQLMNQENIIFLKIIYILILHISPVNQSHFLVKNNFSTKQLVIMSPEN